MAGDQGKGNPKTITIHNKILDSYKIIHVDGAFGGITPQGLINLSFYSERVPIPQASDFEILDDGKIGNFIQNSPGSKTGILREYQVGIYMNIQIAKALVDLLNLKLKEYEELTKENLLNNPNG